MRQLILEYIINNPGSSFVNLEECIRGFAGDKCWLKGPGEVVLWDGISDVAASTMEELIRTGELVAEECGTFPYLVDGKMLGMPIAKSLTHVYKRPHWLPLTFSIGVSQ